jgi:uncharacterized SAM-binding protein YcdF (DUF218 family)
LNVWWRSTLFVKKVDRTIFRISRVKVKILIGFITLGIVLVIFREQWLPLIGDFLFIQDTLHSADVIHVIAGEDYRTDYGIQLYKQGLAQELFFTGGWCDIHHYNHGEHAKERSLAQDVPPDAIAFDDARVQSTYMEAERLKEWIASRTYPVRSVIVISDPFHMRRVKWTYERVLGDSVNVQTAPVPFERTPYIRVWWKDPKSRQNVREEYTKLVYYLFRYQFSRGAFKDWLVSLDTE